MSIEIRGLQKLYSESNVGLGTTDLDIPESQWISIIGPSGCGKTTLLKLIAGLELPSQGAVHNPLSRKDMSYVFQDSALLPWKSVMENITLPLILRGVSRDVAESDAQVWIQKLKLEKFVNHFPAQLSGGLKMRVSVARALITKPKLILMDEPFAALDEPIRIELGLELRELWKTLKPTIVFVTHSITEALWLSDRVLVLQGQPGRIALDRSQTFGDDRPLSLRGTPEFQKNVEECFQLLRANG
jgi:NitT/TauT family transport system ATP-binding protein